MVTVADVYDRLKGYSWLCNGMPYDLYGEVEIGADDSHTFTISGIVFSLHSMNVKNKTTATIIATGRKGKETIKVICTGTRIRD